MGKEGVLVLAALLVAAPVAGAWATPGFNGEAAQEVTGRVFPEARQTNDYVSYFEARDGLQLLEEQNPDLLEYTEFGRSWGWIGADSMEREPLPIFAVEVTDETSDVPADEKTNLLFQLSIHGDEKGGREGGLRVIEDFVLAKETGDDVGVATQDRLERLDEQRLIFVFANPDGWAHEEARYRHNEACSTSATCTYSSGGNPDQTGQPGVEAGDFVRVNGNATDLNRQAPVSGFIAEDHRTLEEPSTYATFTWLKEDFSDIHYSADLHGMSAPADAGQDHSKEGVCTPVESGGSEVCTTDGHFVLGMLPGGQFDPVQDLEQIRLAALANQRINEDPAYDWWRTLPPADAVGGEVATWGTVWDTIQYTDTGFTGDYYAQEHGLDAVTIDYEYAYNNFGTDNRYDAAGMELTRLWIAATRDIVGAYMDEAHNGLQTRPTAAGQSVAWVPTDVERAPRSTDLSARKAAFQVTDHRASVNGYFQEQQAALPGSGALDRRPAGSLGGDLSGYDAVVVPGSAADTLGSEDTEALKDYVEGGGRLVVTDQALDLVSEIGPDLEMDSHQVYAGYTNPDRSHALLDGVEGLARQLVEPIPLGYPQNNMPMWSYPAQDVRDAGGEVAGTSPSDDRATLGVIPVGDGDVVFVGSLLPDPSDQSHAPYRLADHGVTYTGHQVLRNAVGWDVTTEEATAPSGSSDQPAGSVVPGPGLAAVVVAAAAAAIRRRD